MKTGLTGFGAAVSKAAALLGLSGALLFGADRLVGALRRDVHAVLARPAAAPVARPPGPIQVAQVERR